MAYIGIYTLAQFAFQITTERVPLESLITCSLKSTTFASNVDISDFQSLLTLSISGLAPDATSRTDLSPNASI